METDLLGLVMFLLVIMVTIVGITRGIIKSLFMFKSIIKADKSNQSVTEILEKGFKTEKNPEARNVFYKMAVSKIVKYRSRCKRL